MMRLRVGTAVEGAYSRLWQTDGSNLLVSKKLKYFEDMLSDSPFFFLVRYIHHREDCDDL